MSSKRGRDPTSTLFPRAKRAHLESEYERQLLVLNRAFASWCETSVRANPLAPWTDAVVDYVTYAGQLAAKFGAGSLHGEVLTFGSGDCGQLGHGVDEPGAMEVARPRVLARLAGEDVHAISCGGLHNAAVTTAGGLVTWGCSDDDVLGRPGDENYPAPVALLSQITIVQVSAGDCHTTALSLGGDLYAWGAYRDKDGKTWFRAPGGRGGGEAFKRTQKEPALVEGLSSLAVAHGGVCHVASGAHHTVAVCGDGHAFSWGIGEQGQLGRAVCLLKDTPDGVYNKVKVEETHLTPALMEYADGSAKVNNARSASCGAYHTLVVQAMRSRVFATGLNQYGQLGLKGDKVVERLTLVPGLEDLHVASVYGGEHFSMALTAAGSLYSFGRADSSQLGVELSGDQLKAGAAVSEPQLVGGGLQGATVVAASCGSAHAAAVTKEGAVFTWGFGVMLQLGHGKEAEDEATPRRVEGKAVRNRRVVGVSCGGQHTAVICER